MEYKPIRRRNFPNVYSAAVSLGYPYADNGHYETHNGVVFGRFTKDRERQGPAVFVGYDGASGRFLFRKEEQ